MYYGIPMSVDTSWYTAFENRCSKSNCRLLVKIGTTCPLNYIELQKLVLITEIINFFFQNGYFYKLWL